MIQLLGVAAAFLVTLFAILGGIADIQDNLGEYRRQLDAEGFEGITIGFINQTILREGGLLPFLRKHCPTESTKTQFNPLIQADCLKSSRLKAIFAIDSRLSTNDLRLAQDITEIKADLSEIEFKFSVMKPGSVLWEFIPITGDTRLLTLSYVELEAKVFLKKDGIDTEVFRFRKVFRP